MPGAPSAGGLPDAAGREEVLRIHLKRNKQDTAAFDLARLAAACDGFSGAAKDDCQKQAKERYGK